MDTLAKSVLQQIEILQILKEWERIYPHDVQPLVGTVCHVHTVRRRMHKLVALGKLERISYHGGYRLPQRGMIALAA